MTRSRTKWIALAVGIALLGAGGAGLVRAVHQARSAAKRTADL